MPTLRDYKIKFEERFHQKWTSLSVQYHFKAIASQLLQIPFPEVNLQLHQSLTELQIAQLEKWEDELALDKPLQYVLGETEFRNVRILCSPAALIPRPETEELVDLILDKIKNQEQPKIGDMCTGTACIAIALQQEIKECEVIAIDNFEDVLDLAQKNIEINDSSIHLMKLDVLNPQQMQQLETGDFDVWVSNPPYIPEREKVEMHPNVLSYEPPAALFVADENPLLFYQCIASSALKGLKKGGFLFFEIHENFGQETIALLEEIGFSNVLLHQDLQGKNRMISAQNR